MQKLDKQVRQDMLEAAEVPLSSDINDRFWKSLKKCLRDPFLESLAKQQARVVETIGSGAAAALRPAAAEALLQPPDMPPLADVLQELPASHAGALCSALDGYASTSLNQSMCSMPVTLMHVIQVTGLGHLVLMLD